MKNELTPSEIELMYKLRDERISHFFNTKEIDKEAYEEGIKWMYNDLLKLPTPNIVYCDDWISCIYIINILKEENAVRDAVGDTVGNAVRNAVRDAVGDTVWNAVRDTVRDAVGDTVWNAVRNAVWTVWDAVRDAVRGAVGDTVGDAVGEYSYRTSSYNNLHRVSFYSFFRDIGILDDSNFNRYENLIMSGVFQTYEYENYVFAIQPPQYIERDEDGRLNSINRKAFEWANGVGFYYVSGLELKEDLFLKLKNDKFTIEDFLNENNEEIKSACISYIQQSKGDEGVYRFFSKYLQQVDNYVDKKDIKYLKGTTQSMNVGVYTLFKGVINEIDVAYVRCYCPSTDRMFFLGVDPVNTNAKDAIASLYQIPKIFKDSIVSISRQGEKFSTVLTDEINNNIKNNKYSKESLQDYTSITGDEYFKLITYEF